MSHRVQPSGTSSGRSDRSITYSSEVREYSQQSGSSLDIGQELCRNRNEASIVNLEKCAVPVLQGLVEGKDHGVEGFDDVRSESTSSESRVLTPDREGIGDRGNGRASYEQGADRTSIVIPGPLSKAVVLPPRKRRGGRPATSKQPIRGRRPIAPLQDAQTRRQDTALTRRLRACGRCERQRIRCTPDYADPLGPCLTCIRSKHTCPRFDKCDPSYTPSMRPLLPHKADIYRVHVETFDCHDKQRVYIIEYAEFAALGNLNLPLPWLTTDLDRFLDQAIVPLLLVTFNTKNHGDSEDLKWDAVQLAYKLGFNPLRLGDESSMLAKYFRLWVMITTYDLILPATNCTRSLYRDLEQRIRKTATEVLIDLKQLNQQTSQTRRFIIYLILYVHSLCCFGGIQGPKELALPFHHVRVLRELFEAYRSVALGSHVSEEDIVKICWIPSDDSANSSL